MSLISAFGNPQGLIKISVVHVSWRSNFIQETTCSVSGQNLGRFLVESAMGVRKPKSWSRAIFSHAIRRHGAHSNGGVIVQLGEIDCGNVIHLRRGSVQDGAVVTVLIL